MIKGLDVFENLFSNLMEKWIRAICGIQVLRGPALLLIANNFYTYTSKSYKVDFSIFYFYFDVRLLEFRIWF